MRRWSTPVLAAVLGSGATVVVLLATGAMPRDGAALSALPFTTGGTASSSARAGTGVRALQERSRASVVRVRAASVRADPSPYDPPDAKAGDASGSGWVLDEDGLIVCSAHVVASATDVRVTFASGRTVPARPVGRDPETDLALLRVDPRRGELRALELGDSRAVRVGDPAVALSNPSGAEVTVAVGVVAALERSFTAPGGLRVADVIATDAAGSDPGGPLLDGEGRVIGINARMATADGGSATFAVPVATLEAIRPELEATGRVRRP